MAGKCVHCEFAGDVSADFCEQAIGCCEKVSKKSQRKTRVLPDFIDENIVVNNSRISVNILSS